MDELHSSISTPYEPASDAVLQSDWLLVQGGCAALFPCNNPTRSLRGPVLRRRSNPLFPFGDQCATRLLFITRHREKLGKKMKLLRGASRPSQSLRLLCTSVHGLVRTVVQFALEVSPARRHPQQTDLHSHRIMFQGQLVKKTPCVLKIDNGLAVP